MREVQRKIVDIRNPTHIVLKTDEISADDVNNLSDSDNPSVLQIASQTELPNDEEQQGEEVKIERTTGEKVPERKDMGRATSMDGKSNWSKSGKNYEFDATLKKTRNQLDVLKAPPDFADIHATSARDAQEEMNRNEIAWLEENIDPKMKEQSRVGSLSIKLDTQIINKFVGEFGGTLKGAWESIKGHYLDKDANYIFGPGYTISWKDASEFDLNV
jgi:hypothetical protein